QYPRYEFDGEIPPFEDAKVFGTALKESAKWGKITKGNTIPRMNELASGNQVNDFINICEAKHNNMLCHLGDTIYNNREEKRLILVAGPSSSGKTTFTNRVRIELLTRGLNPIMISLDNYYFSKDKAPKDEDGNPDLEHIEALDIKQFNTDMHNLINGKEVVLPLFNFKTGVREAGKTVKATSETPILIEGIHALNERLTSLIPKHQKYKIYIAPQTSLHIDNHNPISITDLRLIRRIVRDQQFRNSSASDTISMWPSVRKGEFKWIYPFQEEADYVFNSELSYELNVLKKHAIPSLTEVTADSKYYIVANRLVKFLKYFKDITDDIVPANSLLREFIGGSNFLE
ncbi:MAG: nucleoside kinase, partial [Acholeplasmatales bacterium]|nr:nucleoside kinase [Acholeplasmatales bacterium]